MTMDKVSMQKIMVIERQLKESKQEAIEEISCEIGEQVLDGVNPIEGNSSCAIVSSKLLFQGGTLHPSYYIPAEQGELVRKALTNAANNGGVERMVQVIEEMAKRKSVVINKQTYALNPKTVSILKNVLTEMA